MARFDSPIIGEVAALGFPRPDRVMITHSSGLVARGVELGRPLGDIDLVTDADNLRYIARAFGWIATRQEKYYAPDLPDNIRCVVSPDGRYDIFGHDFIPELYRRTGYGRQYPDALFANHDPRYDQDEETKIWVASKLHIELTQRGTGRPKDEDTLRRLRQHHEFGY